MADLSKIRVITLKQPWAHFIVHGSKDIENRSWSTNYRGWLVIHAGQRMFSNWEDLYPKGVRKVSTDVLAMGAIVGVAKLVDVVEKSKSPWHIRGQYGWVLRARRAPPEPLPCKGTLGLWRLPRNAKIRRAIEKAIRRR